MYRECSPDEREYINPRKGYSMTKSQVKITDILS